MANRGEQVFSQDIAQPKEIISKRRAGDCHPDLFSIVGRVRAPENGLWRTTIVNTSIVHQYLRAAVWQVCFILRLPSLGTYSDSDG